MASRRRGSTRAGSARPPEAASLVCVLSDTLTLGLLLAALAPPDDTDVTAAAVPVSPADFMNAADGHLFPSSRWFTPAVPAQP